MLSHGKTRDYPVFTGNLVSYYPLCTVQNPYVSLKAFGLLSGRSVVKSRANPPIATHGLGRDCTGKTGGLTGQMFRRTLDSPTNIPAQKPAFGVGQHRMRR